MSRNLCGCIKFASFFALLVGTFILLGSPKSEAISGAPSNFFPDVNANGNRDVYAITQIVSTSESNWATKMKARTTNAAIYVPQNLLGSTISITIIHGCDGAGARDGNWFNGAYTTFRVAGGATTDSRVCGANPNKNINYTFTATAKSGRSLIVDGGVNYHMHLLQADANGPETGVFSLRYINTFQVQANTGGVFAGVSYIPSTCDIASYPRSCPPSSITPPDDQNGNPLPSQSYSYSSFYGANTPNSMRASLSFGCAGGKGQLLVFDLDSNDSTLGQNLTATISNSRGQVLGSLNHAQVNFLGGANNQVLKVPINGFPPGNPLGWPHYDFLPNTTYQLQMTGLSKDNAFQVLPNFYPSSGGCSSEMTCSNFSGLTGAPNTYIQVSFNVRNNSTFTWTASGVNYDIGVVDRSFVGATANRAGTTFPWNNAAGLGPPDHNSAAYIQDSTNGTNGSWHRDSYNRAVNGGPPTDSVERYGTTASVAAGGTRNFSVWVLVPASGSRNYGIRMLSRDARFGPWAWMDWDGSCGFTVSGVNPDVCANIAGNQATVPTGYTQSVANCILSPPTCTALTTSPSPVRIGTNFTFTITLRNSTAALIDMTSLTYTSSPAGISGSVANAASRNIAAGVGSTQTYTSPTHNVSVPDDYVLTITFVYATQYGNETRTATCPTAAGNNTIPITLQPLACNAIVTPAVLGVPTSVSINITNPNAVAVPVTASSWTITPAGALPSSGVGATVTGVSAPLNVSGGGYSMPPNDLVGKRFNSAQNIVISTTGTFNAAWTITASVGATTAGCSGTSTVDARAQPYVRYYGNDVFAGGSYGATCAVGPAADIEVNGFFLGGSSHANYRGSAASLAVFATGQIDGLLPGSQNTSRSALTELSFANTATGTGTIPLGGSFGTPMCADSFPATTGFTAFSGSTLNGLNGDYVASGNITLNASSIAAGSNPVAPATTPTNGSRIRLVVNGNVTINDNITYGAWGSYIETIPLVRIYATGNINISGAVTQLDGLYESQGTISTCREFSDGGAAVNDPCKTRLVVNGAFIAQKVNLYRLLDHVGLSTPGETHATSKAAEIFRFSPEMYLALLAEAGEEDASSLDSLQTLPPAF